MEKPPQKDNGRTAGPAKGAIDAAIEGAIDDGTEESTEERTVECLLEDLEAELLEGDVDKIPTVVERVVAAPARDDKSTGTAASRARAARRQRRETVPSSIPSQLAKSMMSVAGNDLARDPAAPTLVHADVTRRVVGAIQAVPVELNSGGYSVELITQRSGPWQVTPPPVQRGQPIAGSRPVGAPAAAMPPAAPDAVATLIQRACAHMKQGQIGEAVMAADEAIAANDKTRQVDVAHLKDIANGPLARIFFAGGPLNRVPVVARPDHELDVLTLDELQWAILRRMDGRRTIDQVFGATKIPAIDALKIAASLFRAGVIRMDDRALG